MFAFSLRPILAWGRSAAAAPSTMQGGFYASPISSFWGLQNLQATRLLNRNARRPKRANHGKRPVSHARRWEKRGKLTSVAYREKIFGFW